MKKLFTLISLLLFAVTATWAEDETLFSMQVKDGVAAADVSTDTEAAAEGTPKEYSLADYATLGVDGTAAAFYKTSKQGTSATKYIGKLSVGGTNVPLFLISNGIDKAYFKITLKSGETLKVGDVIKWNIYPNKKDKGSGLMFNTTAATDGAVGSGETYAEDAQQKIAIEQSYTVKEGDAIVGANEILVTRFDGTGTYFNDLTITRSGSTPEPPTPVATVTDVLTSVGLGAEAEAGSSYTDFTGKTFTSNAVYSANMSAGNVLAIQLRTNNNNSGIVSTTSGGKVKAVKVLWSTSTETGGATNSARSVEIFGSNTAYTAPTDLYDDNKGTSLGTLALADATENVSTLEVTGDYEYFGIKSTNGALYLVSVEVTWECEAAPTMPAAPVPTVPADQVYNLFSDAYGGYSNNYHYVVWWEGQATQEEVEIAANDKAWHISNFVFIGSEFDEKNLSNYKALNLDVYPVGANLNLGIAPINAGQDINSCINRADLVAGQWNHISIPMTELAATGSTMDRLFQIKLCGLDNVNADGTPEFYVDNIFFEKEAGVPDIEPEVVEPYEYGTACNLFKDAIFDLSKSYYAPGWAQVATPEVTVENGTYTYTLTEATTQQWQAQMKFISDVVTTAANTYDFSVSLKANKNVNGVTVKLYNNENNDVFYLSDVVNLKADEAFVVKHEAMAGLDMTDLCILIDAGGNEANTTIQMIQPVLKESTCQEVLLPEAIDYPTSAEGITIGGTTAYGKVKIHTNTDEIDGIKLANGYTTEEVLNDNYVTIEVDGGFKAGDVITIAGAFNNTDETKKSAVDIFTLDAEGKPVVLFTTQQFVNGRVSADDPVAETYTLTEDHYVLFLGRNGNTATFITTLKTQRGDTPVTIDHLYLLGGKNEWGFANNEELPFDETVQAWIYEVNSPEAEHYFAFADKNDCASWDELNGEHRWALAAGNIVPEINAAYPLAKVNGTVKLPKGSYVVTVTKELVMTVTAATDGISNITAEKQNGVIYNLQGQRVNAAQKGIYIINGKKVMIK